ncbi:MAG TPA: outer membrane lipoprotein carrier protein LolA [Parasegetibacter sp.]
MNKILLFVGLLVGSVIFVNAQTKEATNDPAAKAILDKVSAKFKTFKSVQANFSLKIEGANGKVLGNKKGTVYMKGKKYKVDLDDQMILCDGKNTWTYDKSANEVQISTVDADGDMLTPQKLFTDFYDKDFLYKLNGEKAVNGKTIQEIEMTPVDKSKSFFKVLVLVDKASQTISSATVMEKNGNRFSYGVTSLNGNANLSDAVFVFDKSKYPDVEVVDLR